VTDQTEDNGTERRIETAVSLAVITTRLDSIDRHLGIIYKLMIGLAVLVLGAKGVDRLPDLVKAIAGS
jgi:hypothetical protein